MMSFKKAEIGDYDRIQEYFSLYGENSCQHSFVNMYALYEKYGSQYCELNGFLYILRSRMCGNGKRTYLFPMGAGDRKKAVENIIGDAHGNGSKVRFDTITEDNYSWLMQEFPGVFQAREVRNYAEYLHRSENLANLPGSKFAKKRYDVNLLRRVYEGRMEESILTKEKTGEVLAFEEKWLADSLEMHDTAALNLEYREIEKQLACFDELKISGIIVRIDGIVQGFVYGAPISRNCYDVLIEKGNRRIDDIYRVLNQDVVKMCAMGYAYINREEDLGVPGLRKAKLSYKPDIILKKYIAEEI